MSDGIPFGGSGPQLPGGLSPEDLAAILGLGRPAPQPARPNAGIDALLYDRAGMGGGLNPFAPRDGAPAGPNVPVALNEGDTRRLERGMMPPEETAARMVPLPPGRPSPEDLMMPAPTATGSVTPPGSGMNPGPSAEPIAAGPGRPPVQGPQAPSAVPPDAGMRPADSFDPLTGQPTSGQPKPIDPRQAMAVGAQAVQAQPDIFGKFLTGLQNPQVSNLLLNLGIGLMSKRGFGAGAAAGLESYQAAQGNSLKQQLQQLQIQQQIAGQQAVRAALKGKVPDAMIEAAALNPTVLSSVLAQQNKDPSQISFGGNTYLVPPGSRPDPSNLLGPSAGPPSGYALTPGGGLAPIPGGPEDAATKQRNAEAVASKKPQYVKMKDEQGTEHVFLADPDTGDLTKPRGLPDTGAGGGNPYATGKFNSDQAKAAGFSDRMFGAEPTLRKFEDLNSGNALGATIAGMAPNSMKSSERQQMDQAQRNFINAQLRRESGAAISQGEFDSARAQYFPQPGDGPEVIAQKRQNRREAIEAMAREGGSAYRPKSVFDERGEVVPFGERAAPQTPAQPSRAQLEAEARRRGLIK